MFYIYQHLKADTNAIFYVGKGKGNRCDQKKGRNSYWHKVVNKHGFNSQIEAEETYYWINYILNKYCKEEK